MSMTDEEIRLAVGGVAFPMVSKFNRGDLYSTTEKIVGQWLDGKPIYQKTLTFSSSDIPQVPTEGTKTSSYKTIGSPVETFIYVNGLLFSATERTVLPIPTVFGGTSGDFPDIGMRIILYNNGNLTNANSVALQSWSTSFNDYHAFVTVQYTKSTDSAVNIGTGDDYSTTEQIVGTWIDGKPVYQKTVDCGALPNNTTKSVVHGVSNLDKIVDIKGCAYRSSDGLFISLPRVATSTTYMCEINVSSGNVNIISSTNLSAFGWSYVTFQYTKTTD